MTNVSSFDGAGAGCRTLWPITSPCSGHGTCTLGVCVCDEGWTGLNDIVNTVGIDCSINITAMRLMWTFYTVTVIILMFVQARHWGRVYLAKRAERKHQHAQQHLQHCSNMHQHGQQVQHVPEAHQQLIFQKHQSDDNVPESSQQIIWWAPKPAGTATATAGPAAAPAHPPEAGPHGHAALQIFSRVQVSALGDPNAQEQGADPDPDQDAIKSQLGGVFSRFQPEADDQLNDVKSQLGGIFSRAAGAGAGAGLDDPDEVAAQTEIPSRLGNIFSQRHESMMQHAYAYTDQAASPENHIPEASTFGLMSRDAHPPMPKDVEMTRTVGAYGVGDDCEEMDDVRRDDGEEHQDEVSALNVFSRGGPTANKKHGQVNPLVAATATASPVNAHISGVDGDGDGDGAPLILESSTSTHGLFSRGDGSVLIPEQIQQRLANSPTLASMQIAAGASGAGSGSGSGSAHVHIPTLTSPASLNQAQPTATHNAYTHANPYTHAKPNTNIDTDDADMAPENSTFGIFSRGNLPSQFQPPDTRILIPVHTAGGAGAGAGNNQDVENSTFGLLSRAAVPVIAPTDPGTGTRANAHVNAPSPTLLGSGGSGPPSPVVHPAPAPTRVLPRLSIVAPGDYASVHSPSQSPRFGFGSPRELLWRFLCCCRSASAVIIPINDDNHNNNHANTNTTTTGTPKKTGIKQIVLARVLSTFSALIMFVTGCIRLSGLYSSHPQHNTHVLGDSLALTLLYIPQICGNWVPTALLFHSYISLSIRQFARHGVHGERSSQHTSGGHGILSSSSPPHAHVTSANNANSRSAQISPRAEQAGEQHQHNQKQLARITTFMISGIVLRTSSGFVLLYPIFSASHTIETLNGVGIIYHLLGMSMYLLFYCMCRFYASRLCHQLSSASRLIRDPQRAHMFRKLTTQTHDITAMVQLNCAVNGCVELACAAMPFLRMNSSYTIAISWIGIALTVLLVNIRLNNSADEQSQYAQGRRSSFASPRQPVEQQQQQQQTLPHAHVQGQQHTSPIVEKKV